MFDFGDELIIDNYRIPWLIWIQLLAMFLLVILLYYFATTPSDLSLHFSTATASASASPSVTGRSYANQSLLASNTHRVSKFRENEIKETRPSTSEVVVQQRDEGNDGMMFEASHHHPCHFFGLAKQAFLKCLGLDDNSSTRRTKKDD